MKRQLKENKWPYAILPPAVVSLKDGVVRCRVSKTLEWRNARNRPTQKKEKKQMKATPPTPLMSQAAPKPTLDMLLSRAATISVPHDRTGHRGLAVGQSRTTAGARRHHDDQGPPMRCTSAHHTSSAGIFRCPRLVGMGGARFGSSSHRGATHPCDHSDVIALTAVFGKKLPPHIYLR